MNSPTCFLRRRPGFKHSNSKSYINLMNARNNKIIYFLVYEVAYAYYKKFKNIITEKVK